MGEVKYKWGGQVMEPVDGLAFIGHNPLDADNVYTVTGDSGNGMTHGTIAGMLLTDLILGRHNPWASLYDPGRITLRASAEFAKETVNVAAQYADWVTKGDVESVDDIPKDSGAVVRRGAARSPSIATRPARCTSDRRSALISVASWRGTRPRKRGIARAMDRASTNLAKS